MLMNESLFIFMKYVPGMNRKRGPVSGAQM